MVCPKCGNEQPDVFSQCQKCRYIFPQTQQSTRRITSRSGSSGDPRRWSIILGASVGAALLALALWWLHSPEGLPVVEGSYLNDTYHFAMVAPSDWITLTADNYNELFEKLGDRFPRMLQEGLSNKNIKVGFMKILDGGDFFPSANVVVIETTMPELDEEQLAEGSKVISEGFRRMLDNYKLERSELVTVDELSSAQFTSRGSLQLKVPSTQPEYKERSASGRTIQRSAPDEWKEFDLQFVQTLVPGKKRAYIITCTSLVEQYPEYRRKFEQIVDSFRVIERPSRFGPITMGALNGGLAAALGYLLIAIVMNIVSMFRKETPPPQAGQI
jgi:hypothetical protein